MYCSEGDSKNDKYLGAYCAFMAKKTCREFLNELAWSKSFPTMLSSEQVKRHNIFTKLLIINKWPMNEVLKEGVICMHDMSG